MIQPGQRLRLLEEPGADGIAAVEVGPDADPAIEGAILSHEEDPLGVGGDQALEAEPVPQRDFGEMEELSRLRPGHGSRAISTRLRPARLAA